MAIEYSNQYDVQQILAEEALAKEQAYLTNAVSLAGTPGAGMMMRAQGVGRREGEAFAGLGRMLTGESVPVDPRVAKQDALMKIFEEYGEPENYEDMVKIANVLRVNGFPGEANLAMKEASQFKTDETNRMNATSSATTANTKAPVRDEIDYIKTVNGKEVVYTKTEQYDPNTKTWALVSEAPKYAPNAPTATMSDMMESAKVVDNGDGTYGCDLNNSDCWIKATAIYHATTTKETTLDATFSEAAGKQISTQFENAQKSSGTINTIDASFSALNSGSPITGFASNMRLGLAKMIGAISGDESKDVQATEVWMATTGKLVAELLSSGAFGSGTGLSDNDVKFAKAMVGGDVDLDEDSIRRILYIRRQLENAKMRNWNEEYALCPDLIKANMQKFYTESQITQEEVPWNEDNVYMKPPPNYFIYQNTDYFWPATEYDVDTVTVDEKQWTVHNKNGFDLTREYIDNLAKE